jgi:transcriptional regulator with XRE-family HTH domain
MKTWDEVKSSITSVSDDEKRNIEVLAEIISHMIERRQEIGLSQRDLAEKCGIKQAAIARIETMRTVPQIDTIAKLLKPLGLKLAIVPDEQYIEQH